MQHTTGGSRPKSHRCLRIAQNRYSAGDRLGCELHSNHFSVYVLDMLQNEFLLGLLLSTSDEDWVVVEVGIEDERTKIWKNLE